MGSCRIKSWPLQGDHRDYVDGDGGDDDGNGDGDGDSDDGLPRPRWCSSNDVLRRIASDHPIMFFEH